MVNVLLLQKVIGSKCLENSIMELALRPSKRLSQKNHLFHLHEN